MMSPWNNKHATTPRNARWIRLLNTLRGTPRVLIVDAKCLGTLRAMARSNLHRRPMYITVVNWSEEIVESWDFSRFPSTWCTRGVCADVHDVVGSYNAVYADICGIGEGLLQAICRMLDDTNANVYMATVCTGSRRRGCTMKQRTSQWNAHARAALSVRREKRMNRKSAAMTTLEGHNSKYRALFSKGTKVHIHTWSDACTIYGKPKRPTKNKPWMICVKTEEHTYWNVELSDVCVMSTGPGDSG